MFNLVFYIFELRLQVYHLFRYIVDELINTLYIVKNLVLLFNQFTIIASVIVIHFHLSIYPL